MYIIRKHDLFTALSKLDILKTITISTLFNYWGITMKNYFFALGVIILLSISFNNHAFWPFSSENPLIEKQIKEVKKIIEKNDNKLLKQYLEQHKSDDKDVKNATYNAAFLQAIKLNHLELAQIAIEFGCDINVNNKQEGSALHIAVKNNNSSTVEFLIQKDIKYIKDNSGKTPIDYAKQNSSENNTEITVLLKEYRISQMQKNELKLKEQVKTHKKNLKAIDGLLKQREKEENIIKEKINQLKLKEEDINKEQEKHKNELELARKIISIETAKKNLKEKTEEYNTILLNLLRKESIIEEKNKEVKEKTKIIKGNRKTLQEETNDLKKELAQKNNAKLKLDEKNEKLKKYIIKTRQYAQQGKKLADQTKKDMEAIEKHSAQIEQLTKK